VGWTPPPVPKFTCRSGIGATTGAGQRLLLGGLLAGAAGTRAEAGTAAGKSGWGGGGPLARRWTTVCGGPPAFPLAADITAALVEPMLLTWETAAA